MIKPSYIRFAHIMESIEHIELFLSQDSILSELRTAQAIHYELVVIGEAVSHIDEHYKQRFSDIPWRKMIAMRHILAHEYFNVQTDRILAAIDDLPRIKERLKHILAEVKDE